MKGKLFSLVLGALLLALSIPAEAEQPGKINHIGYLSRASAQAYRKQLATFREGLKELGYFEGKNILIEERYAAGRLERLPGLVAELVRLKPDVIVTHGSRVAQIVDRAASKAGRTIPIVFCVGGDPVGSGHVASLARPGGNITGLSDFHGNMASKRLELLKEIAPSASRIAVLWNSAVSSHPRQLKDIQAAAPEFGMTILPFEVKALDDFDRAFAQMGKARSRALVILGGPVMSSRLKGIADFALKNRMPAIYTLAKFPKAGGLMSYGADFNDQYRRAATYVDRILKGAKPSDLPVEQPTKFELVINLKTAKQLGLMIPAEVLYRADKIIK